MTREEMGGTRGDRKSEGGKAGTGRSRVGQTSKFLNHIEAVVESNNVKEGNGPVLQPLGRLALEDMEVVGRS